MTVALIPPISHQLVCVGAGTGVSVGVGVGSSVVVGEDSDGEAGAARLYHQKAVCEREGVPLQSKIDMVVNEKPSSSNRRRVLLGIKESRLD